MYVAALSSDPVSLENNSALKQLDLNKKMLDNTLSLTRTNFFTDSGSLIQLPIRP